MDRVKARVALKAGVGAQQVGVRHLPVKMAVPICQMPVLRVGRLVREVRVVRVAALEMGLPSERPIRPAIHPAMGATAVVADARAGHADRATPAVASAPVGRQPMVQGPAKGTPKCRAKDQAGGATGPGLNVALKINVGTGRAQMRSPTR